MTDREKPDLSQIPPLSPPPDSDEKMGGSPEVDRVGRSTAAFSGTPPAVGVEFEEEADGRKSEPLTSPETEEQLDQMRRG